MRRQWAQGSGFSVRHCRTACGIAAAAAIWAVCWSAAPRRTHAADETRLPQIVGVRVGFADRYKAGLWTPVHITLRGGGQEIRGRLTLTVPDGDGVPSRVSTAEPCQLPPDEEVPVMLYARFGRVRSTLAVELYAEEDLVAQRTCQAAEQVDAEHIPEAIEARKLVVVVGPAAAAVERAARLLGLPPDRRPVVARLDDLRQLPTKWYGYEGVDAVVLSTSQPEIYRSLPPDEERKRIEALDRWIRLGGRLVFCVGAAGEEILEESSPWRRFAPGRLEKVMDLKETSALIGYCRPPSESLVSAALPSAIRATQLADVAGTVEAHEADLPLVVCTPRGLGLITFFAADLDQPPLSVWEHRSLLAGRLLDFPPPQSKEFKAPVAVSPFGYTDMAGQLRSALDCFEGVQVVPFWAVAVLIVLYILAIGPGDYFFLRRVIGRMEWTWLSFPLIVLGFGLAAYLLAGCFKGSELCIHQADLVDVDAAAGLVRGTTWLNVFSPESQTFDLRLRPHLPDGTMADNPELLFSWLGLPGGALGGMNPDPRAPEGPAADPYGFGPHLDRLEGLPIQVCSSKSLTARWTAKAGRLPAAELVKEGQRPAGTVTNTLDVPLTQCILVYQGWAYELGTLEPGQSATISPELRGCNLRTLLTGRKPVGERAQDKYHHEATPYDPSSLDVSYILTMMMFFETAGGQGYTGLLNDYQGFADLSGLLRTDRAILVGFGPADAAGASVRSELLRDGQPVAVPHDQYTSVFRFVFPVKPPAKK